MWGLKQKLRRQNIGFTVVARKNIKDVVSRAKTEIMRDILRGRVPKTVRKYEDLYRHVDNPHEYGWDRSDIVQIEQLNEVQEILDYWIKKDLRRDLVGRNRYEPEFLFDNEDPLDKMLIRSRRRK